MRLLLAGLLAGISMCFFRSTSLSLYVAGKAVEVSRLLIEQRLTNYELYVSWGIVRIKFLVEELPYSQKYWQELNLAVGSQIIILNILADLNWWFGTGSLYVYM